MIAQASQVGESANGGSADYEIPESYVDQARKAGPYIELSLQEAVRMALENNLQIEIEAYTEEINKELMYGTKGFYDPDFQFRGRVEFFRKAYHQRP